MVSIEDLRRQIRSQVKFSVPFSPLERISRFGDEQREDNGKIGSASHHLLFRDRVLAKGYWKKVLGEIKQERKAPPTTFDKKQLVKIKQIGLPGEYPYVRGVYPTMYRGRPWTMRMFSGFGTPEDTNRRLHYLLEH